MLASPKAVVLAVACLACAASQAFGQNDDPSRIGNRDVGKGVNFYSIERETALGRQLASEVERQAKLCDEPQITEFVNRMGQNLVRNSDAKPPFVFKVVEDASPNAFAFPGGYVFVNTGLIEIAEDEAELAAVLSHEIAHVAARHMTRQATKAQLADLAALPVSIFLGGWAGYAAAHGAQVAVPMTLLKFSRHDEVEADYLGVQYMYAAGYDPAAAIGIFEKLAILDRKAPSLWGKISSTHPADGDRIAATEREIQNILPGRQQYVVSTSEYKDVRERLIELQLVRNTDAESSRPRLSKRTEPLSPIANPADSSAGQP